jgi:NADH:ubiquinone oxidoreductase subunit E
MKGIPLINILNRIQEEQGFISRSAIEELASAAGIPVSQLYGLVSFFKSFRTRPPGKHRISVCYGTACYARGAPLIYSRLEEELELYDTDTSADGFFTVEKVYCVGACSRAPLIMVDDVIWGKIKSYQVPLMLQEFRNLK